MMRQAAHAALIVAGVIARFASAVRGAEAEAAADGWSFSASAYTFVVDDSRDYVSPILKADRGWLHLEARYNYEALDTGSVFAGYNFEWGDDVAIGLTGPVVGLLTGAMGYPSAFLAGVVATIAALALMRPVHRMATPA